MILISGHFNKLLATVVGVLAGFWLLVVTLIFLLAQRLPPSPQISFAFAADSGQSGIQLLDLDHRLPVQIADTSSPIRVGASQPPAYTWSPDGQQLVYEDRANAVPRLMRLTLPATRDILADEPSGCINPVWSVQDKIAYTCGGALYLVGGHALPDTRQAFLPYNGSAFRHLLWSRDGEQLAHLIGNSQRSLVVRDKTGNELLDQSFEGAQPRIGQLLDWSSDGQLIYNAYEGSQPYALAVKQATLTIPQSLTRQLHAVEPIDHLQTFAWSPDQTQAAYIESGNARQLVILDGALHEIEQSLRFVYPSTSDLTWAADGRALYINRFWDNTETRTDLARIDSDSGVQTPITPIFDLRIVNLAWRPGT